MALLSATQGCARYGLYQRNQRFASIFVHFVNNAIVITSAFISSFSAGEEIEATTALTLPNIIYAVITFVLACGAIVGCFFALNAIKNKNKKQVEDIKNGTVETENNIEQEAVDATIQKSKDKAEIIIFIAFIAVSILFWVIENVAHFK